MVAAVEDAEKPTIQIRERKPIMNFFTKSFLLTLLILGGLSACNTMEGLGEDVEATGEAIEDEAE